MILLSVVLMPNTTNTTLMSSELFIDPDTVENNFRLLCSKFPRSSLRSVYEAGCEFAKNKKENLLAKLPTNLDFGVSPRS